MTIEMAANEVVNLGFSSGMQILELVHSLELDNIQTVWNDAIRLSLQ